MTFVIACVFCAGWAFIAACIRWPMFGTYVLAGELLAVALLVWLRFYRRPRMPRARVARSAAEVTWRRYG